MLLNYLKIATRSLLKNTVYTFINVVGLAIGIACSILIMLWVYDEYSYDRFHENYNELYQVYKNSKFSDGISTQKPLPYPLRDLLKPASSSIRYVVMTNWGEGNLLTVGEKRLNKFGMSVGEDFLKMFSFRLIKGDPATALKEPRSIVLTNSTAKALFGDQDPINQLVRLDDHDDLKVSGVTEDVPDQSTITFDYLLPFDYFESTQEWVRNAKNSWDNNSFQMFVQLNQGADINEVNRAIKDLNRKHDKNEPTAEIFLHPVKDWHLYSKFDNGKAVGGMITYVKSFTAIAFFVLLIACINFMNLATARSESRAREVGIRKSVGSRRKDLVFQFLGESLLITIIAFLGAILLVELSMPLYNTIVGKKLFLDYSSPSLWVSAVAVIVVTGVVAGSYPAFYLSSFQPAKVLKGKVQAGAGTTMPRKVMVTSQFGFSILLIIGTIGIYQQIQHARNREIGYTRENLMLIWTTSEIEKSFQTIKNELLRTDVVKSVCKSNSPITRIFSYNTLDWPGKPPESRVSFVTIATEYDYTETMGIRMKEGRDFSTAFKSDTTAMVLNQAAVEVMGLSNPIGSKLKMWDRDWNVIGVMENVVMGNPYEPVEPLVMVFRPDWSSTVSVRLNPTDDLKKSISRVEQIFKTYNPAYPFEYRFADSEFNQKFTGVNLVGKLTNLFATLAIIITCLGLFGLAAFTAEQRTKEIGIRKVLGASVMQLVLLMTKDFSRLVVVAFAIAAPLSWWGITTYLERFPYRTTIAWWVLPVTGLFALLIAVMIVASQAIKAARLNPTETLRSE